MAMTFAPASAAARKAAHPLKLQSDDQHVAVGRLGDGVIGDGLGCGAPAFRLPAGALGELLAVLPEAPVSVVERGAAEHAGCGESRGAKASAF